jgi:hypothetical protein
MYIIPFIGGPLHGVNSTSLKPPTQLVYEDPNGNIYSLMSADASKTEFCYYYLILQLRDAKAKEKSIPGMKQN